MRLARIAALLAFAPLARAADDQPVPLTVQVGQSVSLCATGTIQCPAGAAICDDLRVATPVAAADGLALLGVAPGTTLCSAGAAGGGGARRIYRVTVTPARQPPAKP